jgi:excisionase family DNA binding protein
MSDIKLLEEFLIPFVEKIVDQKLSEKGELVSNVKNPEQFLTIGQAAKEVGCNRNLLQKAIANLELEHYKPENRTYIKRKHLYEYLESIKIRSKNDADYDFLK